MPYCCQKLICSTYYVAIAQMGFYLKFLKLFETSKLGIGSNWSMHFNGRKLPFQEFKTIPNFGIRSLREITRVIGSNRLHLTRIVPQVLELVSRSARTFCKPNIAIDYLRRYQTRSLLPLRKWNASQCKQSKGNKAGAVFDFGVENFTENFSVQSQLLNGAISTHTSDNELLLEL